MDWECTTTRTIDLGYEQLLTFVGRPGTRVRVLYGSMWLTEEGRPQDVFAGCGDEVTLRAHGLSVIEALGVARVQLIEASRGWRLGPVASLARRAWRRLRAPEVLARFVMLLAAVGVGAGVLHMAAPGALVVQDRAARSAPQARAATTVLSDVAAARTGFLAVH
jgi:hypothetical protein